MGKKTETKETSKPRMTFLRIASNILFALKQSWLTSKGWFVFYYVLTLIYAPLSFLTGPYLLRQVVNSVENGEAVSRILIYICVIAGIEIAAGLLFRSLATARILFQCGLPVPAETAEFPVAARICAVFAEAENKDNGGTGSGRFENEVKAVADAIGTLTPGSAVFFNEVFQSAEYREASEEFADILSYLTDTGVQWTAVTHLDKLKDCLPEGSTDILTTVTGFRVIRVL